MADVDTTPNRAVMIVLAYLWPLALVPLLLDRHDAEVHWHAKHGLVLMAAELAALFAYIALTTIVSLASLGLGFVLLLFIVFAWMGILAVHVVAILKGVSGRRLNIPGLSHFASRV